MPKNSNTKKKKVLEVEIKKAIESDVGPEEIEVNLEEELSTVFAKESLDEISDAEKAMLDDPFIRQALESLQEIASEQGVITIKDIVKHMPPGQEYAAMEGVIQILKDQGIEVQEREIEESDANSTNSIASSDDNVRLYLREMGSIDLLSREEEIAIAESIQVNKAKMIELLVRNPICINTLHSMLEQLKRGACNPKNVFDFDAYCDIGDEEQDINTFEINIKPLHTKISSLIEEQKKYFQLKKKEITGAKLKSAENTYNTRAKEVIKLLEVDKLNPTLINKIITDIYNVYKQITEVDTQMFAMAEENGISKELFREFYYGDMTNKSSLGRIEAMYKVHDTKISEINNKISEILEKYNGIQISEFRKIVLQLKEIELQVRVQKDKMICANLRLVISLAKKFLHSNLPFMDLAAEGNTGLMRAVDKFDHTTGNKFSTYASYWVRQAISRAIADHSKTIRVPVHATETINKIVRESRNIMQQTGKEATIEQLSKNLGISPQKITKAMNTIKDPISLETPIGSSAEDGVLCDFVEDQKAISPIDSMMEEGVMNTIKEALGTLTSREDRVIRLRFGINTKGEYTLEEVGKLFGVTRERIRQIEAKALRKLAHFKKLRPYSKI